MKSSLRAKAQERRDRSYGKVLTYSPKVFLPVTNLCRNRCGYCSFRRSPGEPGEHTMSPDDCRRSLDAAQKTGCFEALLCLGDTPKGSFVKYQRLLQTWGFDGITEYLAWISEEALSRGLLAHTNAGILQAGEMAVLRKSNVSMGLMLESSADRLCEPGLPHHQAPDKKPASRLAMIEEAGRQKIPFTSGLLIGIGETARERSQSINELAELQDRFGHLQELILQPFRPHAGTPMQEQPEAPLDMLLDTIAEARMMLPEPVTIQAPPNLAPGAIEGMIDAGINDFGGISPLTPDFINPGYAWPHIDTLAERCARAGFELQARLPLHQAFIGREGWLDDGLRPAVEAAQARLSVAR
jgi:FO synthase